MLRRLRRAAGIVATTAVVAAVAGVAVLFWLVRQEGWLVQTVASGSMAPTVPTGSLILSRPVAPADIEVGDVIVFRSPTGATVSAGAEGTFEATDAMLITHRVVGTVDVDGEPGFRTRGDGNAEQDPWTVTGAMVRARYVTHVPAVGGFLALPGTRRWLFLGVAAPGCVVMVAEGRTVVRELRAKQGKTPAPEATAVGAAAAAPLHTTAGTAARRR